MNEDRLQAVIERLRGFVAQRDWAQFHDPKNLAMAIASEAGELVSELRWVDGRAADSFVRVADAKARIEAEVADIAIALLLFCDRTGIDLVSAVDRKIEVNAAHYPVKSSRGRPERP
jgi:NTP pyrophosphatase (non-canonical NTP hydrolase)